MGQAEIIDINDYISMVEQTIGRDLTAEQRIGEVLDLENVIKRLHAFCSHITNIRAQNIIAKLEKRATDARKTIDTLYLRKSA